MKQVLSDSNENTEVKWIKSANMLSDCSTKKGVATVILCQVLEEGFIDVDALEI